MKVTPLVFGLIVFIFLLFKIFLGIQINFNHEDFNQIFLLGLENAYSGRWTYWGADVVWSQTHLPGALQGLLVGVPLKMFNHPYAPIILSNIISMAGLVLLILYAFKRFPDLPRIFILLLTLLLPFSMIQGAVLLNTTYLLLSGSLLFIAVCELFIYRDQLVLKSPYPYFFTLGFALLFTYQLHLTWVMFLPFIVVLLYLERKRSIKNGWKPLGFFTLGAVISGLTLFPTLLEHSDMIFSGSSGYLTFKPERLGSIFDLFVRYFTFATFDVNAHHNYFVLAAKKSQMAKVLFISLKVIAIVQLIVILFALFKTKKSIELKKSMILFGLTLIMALFLYVVGNKHLSSRTYILLYPIPIWLSFYAYTYLRQYRQFKTTMTVLFILLAVVFINLATLNYQEDYSFKSVESKIEKAMDNKNAAEFGIRRIPVMDDFK